MSTTPLRRHQGGFALEATLGILVLMSILVVTVYASAMAAFQSGSSDVGKQRSYYAAEAGAESGMSQLADALEDAVLDTAEMTSIVAPSMAGFSFDSFSVTKIDTVRHERITDGAFTGLYSLTQMVEIYSEASDQAQNSSAVVVTAKAQAIPIFQFGIFYEKDLEIHNGPPLTFEGWVHTNGNLYLNSSSQYFADLVTTPNNVYHDRKDSHSVTNGVWIADATTTYLTLNFDSRDTPVANDFRNKSDTRFDNRLKTNAYGVDTLSVPLPAGMSPIAVIEPRDVADGPLEIQAKMAHKADWYIEVPLGALSDPDDLCDEMIHIREAGKVLPNDSQCEDIFVFDWNDFWEGRELTMADAINVNLNELFSWTGSNDARITNILYIYFTGAGVGDYPVVRLQNGTTLGNPITISSVHPILIQGNYNTGTWQPSAVLGDNITFLSNAWTDGAHQAAGKTDASDTNVYAAVMAGHTETPCDHEVVGCGATSPYGGGLENFPRFLERWTGETLMYRGSLVSLYFAAQSTGTWGGHYYNPPGRDWAFDTRFDLPENLPPGTPVVGNVIHTAFRPVY